jgi:hypothetical protein
MIFDIKIFKWNEEIFCMMNDLINWIYKVVRIASKSILYYIIKWDLLKVVILTAFFSPRHLTMALNLMIMGLDYRSSKYLRIYYLNLEHSQLSVIHKYQHGEKSDLQLLFDWWLLSISLSF